MDHKHLRMLAAANTVLGLSKNPVHEFRLVELDARHKVMYARTLDTAVMISIPNTLFQIGDLRTVTVSVTDVLAAEPSCVESTHSGHVKLVSGSQSIVTEDVTEEADDLSPPRIPAIASGVAVTLSAATLATLLPLVSVDKTRENLRGVWVDLTAPAMFATDGAIIAVRYLDCGAWVDATAQRLSADTVKLVTRLAKISGVDAVTLHISPSPRDDDESDEPLSVMIAGEGFVVQTIVVADRSEPNWRQVFSSQSDDHPTMRMGISDCRKAVGFLKKARRGALVPICIDENGFTCSVGGDSSSVASYDVPVELDYAARTPDVTIEARVNATLLKRLLDLCELSGMTEITLNLGSVPGSSPLSVTLPDGAVVLMPLRRDVQ